MSAGIRTTLFVSDLHIDAKHPDVAGQFLSFIEREARRSDALYILGDLFESWIGDDAPDASQRAVMAHLASLTASGVPCFVMHGNRDFLLGPLFCAQTGCRLLPDPLVLTLYGEEVLVMHGDALCASDAPYQRLRATVRDPDWQRRFLALPAGARRAIAGAARRGSQEHMTALDESITDVAPDCVESVLRRAGVRTLLHGHTHRPACHTFMLDGVPHSRIVLGDWHLAGSVLKWSMTGRELVALPRGQSTTVLHG